MNFGATNQFSPKVQISDCLAELGPEIMYLCWFLDKNQNVLRTGNMGKQSNYDSGETENYPRKPSENYGEHPEKSTGVFYRPAE